MTVVSNTSPICYLLLINEIDVLPQLYGQVIIPQAVYNELRASGSPLVLQNWIAQPPDWLKIRSVTTQPDTELEQIDIGEREAILLAEQLGISAILLDDKAARRIAIIRGLNVTGVLGILGDAATMGFLDLPAAIERLRQTGVLVSSSLIQSLLERHQNNS